MYPQRDNSNQFVFFTNADNFGRPEEVKDEFLLEKQRNGQIVVLQKNGQWLSHEQRLETERELQALLSGELGPEEPR